MLTKRQKQVLDFIRSFREKRGYAPSLEEIKKHLKLSSVSTAHHHVLKLENEGCIRREKNEPRAIEPLEKGEGGLVEIPLVGTIAAGSPIEAIEAPETIRISKSQLSSSGEHYALRVRGDSMVDEGIYDRDIVVIRKQSTAENGDTVVALLNGNEVTLKKIYREKDRFRLQPANPELEPIFTKELLVQGKVISVIRTFEELKELATSKKRLGSQETRIARPPKSRRLPINNIICGDSYYILQQFPDKSVNLVVTSPPYFQQRDYGKGMGNEKDVGGYLNNLLKIFRECVRITTEDGSIVFNVGDKYRDGSLLMVPYRFAIEALKSNPIKLINIITWVKSNPTPRQFKRRLVSSTEPFFHFVKANSYYYNINAFMSHINLFRSKANGGTKIGQKYFDLIEGSSLSKEEKHLARKELLKVIQEVRQGKIEGFRMKIRGIHSKPFGGQEGGRKIQLEKRGFTIIKILGNGLKKDIIECPVETIKGTKHPAIYPEYIIQELIKLLTKEGELVLDPFVGSGTTAVASKKTRRNYIGIDINPEYCKYAESRLKDIKIERGLFEFVI